MRTFSRRGVGTRSSTFRTIQMCRSVYTRLGNDVVIKVPTQRVLQDQEFIERFQAEIRSLVQLSHPHVVKIIDVGEHEETPFVVMQYLAGGTLTDLCDQAGGKLPLESLKDWLSSIADAVDFVHRQDAIHRDVKPSNILFDSEGNAFQADFGLSKVISREAQDEQANRLTATGFVVGTPQYAAPEIVMGHKYDGRADQYSLAVTVYETIAGESPVAGSTPSATMVNQINIVPPFLNKSRPDVPTALAKAVARGLEKIHRNVSVPAELLRKRSCCLWKSKNRRRQIAGPPREDESPPARLRARKARPDASGPA